jgi:hypothetical protein
LLELEQRLAKVREAYKDLVGRHTEKNREHNRQSARAAKKLAAAKEITENLKIK